MTNSNPLGGALPLIDPANDLPDELIAELRGLDDACGPKANKYHRVITLISACILSGVNTGTQIVEAITQAGFTKRYVGLQLSAGLGTDSARHWWTKDADGRYQLLA